MHWICIVTDPDYTERISEPQGEGTNKAALRMQSRTDRQYQNHLSKNIPTFENRKSYLGEPTRTYFGNVNNYCMRADNDMDPTKIKKKNWNNTTR